MRVAIIILALCGTAAADVGGAASEDHDEAIDSASMFPWYMPPERPKLVAVEPSPHLVGASLGFHSLVGGDFSGSVIDARFRFSIGFAGMSVGALHLSPNTSMTTTTPGQNMLVLASEFNRVSGHQIYRGEEVRAWVLFPSFELGASANSNFYLGYGRLALTGVRVQLCGGYRLDIRGPAVTEFARGAFSGSDSGPKLATAVGLEIEVGVSN